MHLSWLSAMRQVESNNWYIKQRDPKMLQIHPKWTFLHRMFRFGFAFNIFPPRLVRSNSSSRIGSAVSRPTHYLKADWKWQMGKQYKPLAMTDPVRWQSRKQTRFSCGSLPQNLPIPVPQLSPPLCSVARARTSTIRAETLIMYNTRHSIERVNTP